MAKRAVMVVLCALVAVVVILIVLMPRLERLRHTAMQRARESSLMALGFVVRMYALDNDNRFPASAGWCDAIKSYASGSDQIFQIPFVREARCAYGFNANLSGLELSKVRNPSETVLLFETKGGWNISGGRVNMISRPRLPHGYLILFVDGRARTVAEEEVNNLIWKP